MTYSIRNMTNLLSLWGYWGIFGCLSLVPLFISVKPDSVPLKAFLLIGMISICIWLVRVDIKEQRLPDVGTGGLLILGTTYAVLVQDRAAEDVIWGMIIGGGFVWLVRWAHFRWRGREGLGLGDVKFMIAAGAWTGPDQVLWVVIIAACGLLCLITLSGSKKMSEPVAFGPALVCALLMSVFIDGTRGFL